jgi:hypothetical protein
VSVVAESVIFEVNAVVSVEVSVEVSGTYVVRVSEVNENLQNQPFKLFFNK